MNRKRIYESIIEEHLKKYSQMVFLSGPRQVGKTTVGEHFASHYGSWDDSQFRSLVPAGQKIVAEHFGIDDMSATAPVIVFDEIHKYSRWKQFLKGFFDLYGKRTKIIATGSARMDIYKKGSDSMMGRYFPYRMHPFSVAELLDVSLPGNYLVRKVSELPNEDWDALLKFGGFPDPFLNRDARFSRRWNSLRFEQLMRTDARDISRVSEIDQMALLAELISNRSGEQLVYKNLGREIGIDEKTAKAWVKTLKNLYFGFEVRPWFVNIENSIRKTPKWYLRDWAGVKDDGKRAETLIACHLLKAVEGWTDLGYGEFSLGYLRDKSKREVDFIVARDGAPWFLVEVKKSKEAISDSLGFFQKCTKAKHAFQVVIDAEYVDRDCFEYDSPIAVPAKTFLSQLL